MISALYRVVVAVMRKFAFKFVFLSLVYNIEMCHGDEVEMPGVTNNIVQLIIPYRSYQ